jgi:hypothetical protein
MGHGDENVSFQHLGIQQANAVESGVLAFFDKGGNLRQGFARGHS